MIQVYGRDSSANVQAVMWCVAGLGLEHERLDVGGSFGGTDTAEYRALNPMGLVPVLKDGGKVLWESPTIVRYLMKAYGDHPQDAFAAAQIEQWADWTRSHFYPQVVVGVFYQLYRMTAEQRKHGAVAAACAEMKHLGTIVSKAIKGPYFMGDRLTLADYAFGTLMHRYFVMEFDRGDFPVLRAYYDALCDRPAYRAQVMKDPNVLKVPGA